MRIPSPQGVAEPDRALPIRHPPSSAGVVVPPDGSPAPPLLAPPELAPPEPEEDVPPELAPPEEDAPPELVPPELDDAPPISFSASSDLTR